MFAMENWASLEVYIRNMCLFRTNEVWATSEQAGKNLRTGNTEAYNCCALLKNYFAKGLEL